MRIIDSRCALSLAVSFFGQGPLSDLIIGNLLCVRFLPMQPGDVYQTYADVSDLERDFGFKPSTSLVDGLREFARWYKRYYKIG